MEKSRGDRFATHTAPLTWEIPTAATAVALFTLVLTPLAVQAVVAWTVAGDFAWPTNQWGTALLGLSRGRFGDGLPGGRGNHLPADGMMWALTALGEALTLGAAWRLGQSMRELLGLGSTRHGLATSAQAAHALGLLRLRTSAAIVRPDLYAHRTRRHRLPGAAAPANRPQPTGLIKSPTKLQPTAAARTAVRAGRGSRLVEPQQFGWRLGRAGRGGPALWVPYDRTTCVIGPQGSGKTLDLLVPALLDAPGGALVTLTKPEDLYLTLQARQQGDRPVAVLDPFNLAPGTPKLVWDPIAGCQDPMQAERRAKAFAAGTIQGATLKSTDQAARFYAGECAKVLQAYFHAAAIAGAGLDDLLTWVSNPRHHPQAEEILRTHPAAEPLWDGLLRGALYGDQRTAGNTITTVQQAMALFFQHSIRQRCVPSPSEPATDLAELIRAGGTIYLLGREDPYASASPLMTAVTEQILDTAKHLGETSPHGRLCPPFLACLDEVPSTAPIPTLSTRLANERALGLSFILAAQTWRQFLVCYGEDEARTIYGLSNNLVVFGGGKDIRFYQEVSDLIGSISITETRYTSHPHGWSSTRHPSWEQRRVPILEAAELRRLEQRKALVLAETYEPIVANLHRCIDGPRGLDLLAAQERARRAARNFRADNPTTAHPTAMPT